MCDGKTSRHETVINVIFFVYKFFFTFHVCDCLHFIFVILFVGSKGKCGLIENDNNPHSSGKGKPQNR